VPPGAEYIPPSNFIPPAQPAPPQLPPSLYGSNIPATPSPMGPDVYPNITGQPPVDPNNLRFTDAMQGPGTNASPFGPEQSAMNASTGVDRLPVQNASETLPNGGMQMRDAPTPYEWTPQTTAPDAAAATQPSGIENLFNQGLDWAKKNPLQAGMGAMALYNYMNKPEPYEKPKYKSTFNASAYRGYEPTPPAPYRPQYAHGGLADLGGYSDGGRLLRGPGDGVSDSIPAVIGGKQPARLADGEFVIPARIVSELGNGSTEAGARRLYAMMDRIQSARKKTVGKNKVAKNTRADKYLPA